MMMKKKVRTKGKLQFSRYFQELKTGDTVALVKEPSLLSTFPLRLQGRTGTVIGKRGRAYIVKVKDSDMEKKYLVEPIHLKKLKTLK